MRRLLPCPPTLLQNLEVLYRQYGRDGNKHGLDWQEVAVAIIQDGGQSCDASVVAASTVTVRRGRCRCGGGSCCPGAAAAEPAGAVRLQCLVMRRGCACRLHPEALLCRPAARSPACRASSRRTYSRSRRWACPCPCTCLSTRRGALAGAVGALLLLLPPGSAASVPPAPPTDRCRPAPPLAAAAQVQEARGPGLLPAAAGAARGSAGLLQAEAPAAAEAGRAGWPHTTPHRRRRRHRSCLPARPPTAASWTATAGSSTASPTCCSPTSACCLMRVRACGASLQSKQAQGAGRRLAAQAWRRSASHSIT